MNIFKRIVRKINRFIDKRNYKTEYNILVNKLLSPNKDKRIILFQTPNHTNIGDHAIAEAEVDFINKHFADYTLIEVNQAFHYPILRAIKGNISDNDIIMLHGGGNLGDLYIDEENIRRSTVSSFPNNKIIVFPQTIYYSSGIEVNEELNKTISVFSAHNNLTLIARETVSFDLMKSYFSKNKVLFMPDIVLSMNKTDPKYNRDGILMVLREDEERILDEVKHKELDVIARKFSNQIVYSDMHYHKQVRTVRERDKLLKFKFDQFKNAKVVITDRLHGMVFAAITKTPCIAFSNYNQKVSGTYKWIEHLKYIKYVDKNDDIEKILSDLLALNSADDWDPAKHEKYFEQLVHAIKK